MFIIHFFFFFYCNVSIIYLLSLFIFFSSKNQTLLQFPSSFIFVNVISILQFIFYTY